MIKIERGNPPKNNSVDKRREKELRKISKLAESRELKSGHFKLKFPLFLEEFSAVSG